MKKLIFALGLGIGFVLGSRMGRGPYEKLEQTARQVADDPRVQETVAQARDAATKTAEDAVETARTKGPEVAEQLKDRAASGVEAVKDRVSGDSSGDSSTAAGSGDESTAPDADTDGRAAASAGGDGEVGDKPLES